MTGEFVENFTLKDQNGNDFNLYDNLDKKVLLVFYPKDNSPVCSKQLVNYSTNKKKFDEYGIKAAGVNTESAQSHISFCNSLGIDMPLLIDENKIVSRRFDALNILGINKRKLVLIGTDKKILFEKSSLPVFYFNSEKIIEMLKADKII